MNTFDLNNKTVLITGGTSGLGLAAVKAFEQAGASVIVAARNQERAAQNLSPQTDFVSCDMSKRDDIKALFQHIEDKYGRLDIALNGVAADSGAGKPIQAFSDEEFDVVMDTNLKSTWLAMKHEIALMQNDAGSPKHIINTSSINGLGGLEYASLYAASKAGIIALSKSAALELARTNISVNVVVPGPFETPLLEKALAMQSGGNEEITQTIKEQYKQFIPKGRFGRPEEFAQAVLWLCSQNDTYMSGHSLILDGGMSARFR